MDLDAFGRLPVVYEGRVKPFDTIARNALIKISDRAEFVDASGAKRPAIQWLLDVISESDAAGEHKVFRIYNLDLLETLGLEPPRLDLRHQRIRRTARRIQQASRHARAKDPAERSAFERKALELDVQLRAFNLLYESFRFPVLRFPKLAEGESMTPEQMQQVQDDIDREVSRQTNLTQFVLPNAVPPEKQPPNRPARTPPPVAQEWQPFTIAVFDAMNDVMAQNEINPGTDYLLSIFDDYRTGNARAFNAAVAEYGDYLEKLAPRN